jgi:hypothetical protein
MICPLFMIANCALGDDSFIKTDCMKLECALWNERFGMCSLAVDAYLKGQEDWQKEQELIKKGG